MVIFLFLTCTIIVVPGSETPRRSQCADRPSTFRAIPCRTLWLQDPKPEVMYPKTGYGMSQQVVLNRPPDNPEEALGPLNP